MSSVMEQIIDRMLMKAPIEDLLSKLPDIDVIDPNSGRNLLTTVLYDSAFGYVPDLLRHGAKINALGKRGMTVWLCSVQDGNLHALEYLLQLKANTDLKNDQGQGTEYIAAKYPVSTECTKFLIAKGLLTPSATFQDLDGCHYSLLEATIMYANIELFEHILSMLDTITKERVKSVREFLEIFKNEHGELLSSQFTTTFETGLERIGGVMADHTSQVQSQPRRNTRRACRPEEHT